MEVKFVARLLADILGISSFFLGWVSNLDNIKSAILFIVGLIYIMVRLFFYIKKQISSLNKERQEAEMMSLKLKRERLDMKEKEIEVLERELSIRITGVPDKYRRKPKN